MGISTNVAILRHNPSAAAPPKAKLSDTDGTFFVYIMASERGGDVAVCMAQDIAVRVANQKNDLHPRDYTSVHGIHTLVRVDEFSDVCEAMTYYNRLREMDTNALSRVVDEDNPAWADLYADYAA
jgi:predicted GIY-YIG superfamily endonuclease